MKTFALLGLIAAAKSMPLAKLDDSFESVINEDFIEKLNSEEDTWKAGKNKFFEGKTLGEARGLLGAQLVENTLPVKDDYPEMDVPDSFDARDQWGSLVHPIRDQQQCGSCWAFSASEVLSDRFAIQTNGTTDVVLSPEDMVSCDKGDMGCQGGILASAWSYLSDTGIVSDTCFPYTAGTGTPSACETKCVDGGDFTKYKSTGGYAVTTVDNIQKEIMTNGPVQAGFTVYKSFMSYTTGVYKKKFFELTPEGGHAIKIIGWGVDSGTDYWLVANSWNTSWGLDGYFKILRGKDECKIEDQVYAGLADTA